MRITAQAMTPMQPRMVGNDCNSGSDSMVLPERASQSVTDFKNVSKSVYINFASSS
jgi:hypothetical protein